MIASTKVQKKSFLVNIANSIKYFSLAIQGIYDEISAFCPTIGLSELKLKASNINLASDDKTLFRNFIDGIEMLNNFLVDFQEIKEKNIVLDRFLEEHSKANTFRNALESWRKHDGVENIVEVLKKSISSDEEYDINMMRIVDEVRKNERFLLKFPEINSY